MQVISVYSNALNSGRKTIAMALGQEAAKNNHKTLLVELDYLNNGIAHTYGITNSTRNAEGYFSKVFKQKDFSLGNFILKKDQFEVINKEISKAHAAINSVLDFLVYSNEYRPAMFPSINDFSTEKISKDCKRFFEELRLSEYDLVILLLPTDYEDMFAIPMILESDHIINVVGFSLSSIEEAKRISTIFDSETLDKMKYVLNLTTKKIDKADYEHWMKPLNLVQLVSFDEQRLLNEVNADIGSPVIDAAALNLLQLCGVDVAEQKRSLFSRR